MWRPGPGIGDDVAASLPVFHRDEGWAGEVLRSGRVVARDDVRGVRKHGYERYDGSSSSPAS